MYQVKTLANGVRLVVWPRKECRSAALGLWVGTGSRQESEKENGAAHFIEHMVFKGTEQRSAADLAREMDALGGQFNAFTTKECTCFYGRCLDSHIPRMTDLLTDMFFHSRFDPKDVETERGVILEEIGMYQDTPDDLVSEILARGVYPGSSLSRPILGTAESLKTMTGDFLRDYMKRRYLPGDVVVSLAGSYGDEDVVRLEEAFSSMTGGKNDAVAAAEYAPAVVTAEKPIEQNHLVIAFPSLPRDAEERYTCQILSSVLGGGMSSRLFQRVREQKGLCYSIYSYGSTHADTGLFCIYTALGKDTEEDAIGTILEVVRDMAEHGITQQELDGAREQSKANVLMGLESNQSMMNHAGRSLLQLGRIPTPREVQERYDAITGEQVRDLAQQIFDFSRISLSAVGRVREKEAYAALLK